MFPTVTFVSTSGSRLNNCMEENWAKLKVFWATLDFLSRQKHLCKARKNVQVPSKRGHGGPTRKEA